jgi:acyl-CoA synthetase (AMP-forming)/AMP-acid ligase II
MRVIDCFDKGASLDESAPMFIDAVSGEKTSFEQIKHISERVAAAIIAVNGSSQLSAADGSDQPHIGIYTPNDPRGFACMLANWRSGGVWVPINSRNTAQSNVDFSNTAKVSWLFYHSMFAGAVTSMKEQVPSLRHCVCIDQPFDGDMSLEQFMEKYAKHPVPDLDDDPDRLVAIMGSGGTTGKSKGILHSARVWETMINTAWQVMPYVGDRPVHLMAAPMTHAAGGFAAVLMPWGPTNIVLDKVDPVILMESIQKHKVTHLFLPPTALYAMMAHPDVRKYDYSSLKYFLVSAAPVSPDKLAEAVEIFGPCMCSCWGQAESPFFLTWLSPKDVHEGATVAGREHLLKSCGTAVVANRIEVMDSDLNLLPNDEKGELVMKGNLRMVEYFNNPEATAEIRDAKGWQHTGDVGVRDDEGYFYIVDRIKDMIITGGFNVYSAEVEKHINSHAAVLDCAVFGIPDEKWGEAVHATVQLKPGEQVSADDMITFCKDGLASVKTPKSIDFTEALPRSPVGKVLKRALRDEYWKDSDSQVS